MAYQIIGIIGAMNEEIELLLKHTEIDHTTEKAGMTFYQGNLQGQAVIFAKSGVGKVNAAVCTQVLIGLGAECVLFTGVAGALDPRLEIGDIVISSSCMQHDMDVTPLGFARGVIPYQDISDFAADPDLVELAQELSRRLFDGRSFTGKILSGDQFIASRETVKELYEQLGGIATEMEGAALAQVCWLNAIPYVVIRSMSDKADGSAHVNFAEFTGKASNHSYQIIEAMVARLKAE
ncbi:5'-methylthioadenosine/adenosylhomocysteine nucleosidase [Paenibacillus sp. GCM10012307]|uniref:adenosylhomocysteine nucleosidase n=1 Tax=Paenibacillus roseus TaxID=2798579 RepID=A0A934MRV2_9BACL|nr:5'-methylthioadenosine/adenosylhomocysteine nucleosidase [Paenibacillus roseus]MBJ6363263.1 5'-methylthioadenosine/adenosylhomocysteine nucleosidase [Paenibacillus roseus]